MKALCHHSRVCVLIPLTALLLATLAVHAADQASANDRANVLTRKVEAKATPFDLRDVQLLDGPFKHAQDVNRQLLLKMDVDRLLYPFRREAKLPSPVKGPDELKFDHTGHAAGHYLSACAMIIRNTGDVELKKKADGVVAVLAECQANIGNGYIGGFPERSILHLEGLIKDPSANANVPWYCLHKIYAGLLDMAVLAENQQAFDVLKKAIDWVDKNTSPLSEEKMQGMLGTEHGAMNELLANLYAATGDAKYIRLAQRFNHKKLLDPFVKGEDPLDGYHANTQIPKFVGAAREYELGGEADLGTAAVNFWNAVIADRTYVTGGNSYYELFSPKGYLSHFLGERTTESCNVYNMLKLTRTLFCTDSKALYADYYERALLNHILSTRDPETGGQLYYQLLQSGNTKGLPNGWVTGWRFIFNEGPNAKLYGHESQCCQGSGLESNAKYADSIYFHSGVKELYVNLFIPSVLNWKSNGLTLRQETKYPEQGSTKLFFACQKPVSLSVKIRHPGWTTEGFDILVNGKKQQIASIPGSTAQIERTWADGDTVEVIMPMSLRVEGFKDNPTRVALMYGPLVMAGVTEQGNPFSVIEAKDDSFLKTLKPIEGKPLQFEGPATLFRTSPLHVSDKPVVFRPLYSNFTDAYAILWDLVTPASFEKMAAQVSAEIKLQKECEPRTVDMVQCGRAKEMFTFQTMLLANKDWMVRAMPQISEGKHGLKTPEVPVKSPKGRSSSYVQFLAHKMFFSLPGHFRSLEAGDWCSYQMQVLPQQEQQLDVRLWKASLRDLGAWAQKQGKLEIVVDGRVLATCEVESLPCGQFSTLTCPLPPDLLVDKKKIEVLLRVSADSSPVYGIYECRILAK